MITYKDELYHHGIKGQKWGVRRYRNEDGTLTPEGRMRYGRYDTDVTKRVKDDWNGLTERAFSAKYGESKQSYLSKVRKVTDPDKHQHNFAQWQKDQSLDKINKSRDKIYEKAKGISSKTFLATKQKYIDQGMSEKEATITAYKNQQAKKIMLAIGGVAVTGLAAYGAYKYRDYVKDQYIDSGELWNRVASSSDKGIHDAFYAAKGKDVIKYEGMYATQKAGILGLNPVYTKQLHINDKIKVASEKHAIDAMKTYFAKSAKGKTEAIDAIQELANTPGVGASQKAILEKGLRQLKSGKIGRDAYHAFNIAALDLSSENIKNGFFKELKDQGYDAIGDINDKKYSGYRSKTATIFFNKDKVSVGDVRQLATSEIKEKTDKVVHDLEKAEALDAAKIYAGQQLVTILLPTAAVAYSANKYNDKRVAEYQKKHPNSDKTYAEIVDMYNKGRS